jgi:chromate transporter
LPFEREIKAVALSIRKGWTCIEAGSIMALCYPPRQGSITMLAGRICDIFLTFLRLGLTSFGGPVAHLGYFHREIVMRRGWLTEASYAELVGLGQFLPGPASSQVGFAIGLTRGGWWGGVAAWIAFTLPSALAMLLFSFVADRASGPLAGHAIHGLKLVAIPIVTQALFDMARKLTPDIPRGLLASGAAILMLVMSAPAMQLGVILAGGLAGMLLCREQATLPDSVAGWRPTSRSGIASLLTFAGLFVVLPMVAPGSALLALAAIFYRAGALVFGGGHVVLPLLRAELVPTWMGDASFLAGYGAAQAVPGPLFTLAAYLGGIAWPQAKVTAAFVSLIALSLPGLLLMAGVLPFQAKLRQQPIARGAVAGINAAVVGLLAAALYNPLWTTGVRDAGDVAVVAIDLGLLIFRRWPPLAIVLLTVAASVIRVWIG